MHLYEKARTVKYSIRETGVPRIYRLCKSVARLQSKIASVENEERKLNTLSRDKRKFNYFQAGTFFVVCK